MQRGDSGDFSDVTLNTPLVADDKVSTGDDSRTELELDHADVLRLDSNSDAHIVTLTRSQIRVQLGEGLANYSIMNGAEADVVIEAPNVAVHPLREGRYRIQVIGDSDAEVTVRDGEAEISTDEGNTHVKNGQVITVHGTGQDAEYKIADAPSADDWDQWNRDRDNTIENARSYQETNRYYTGAHDLDGYGVWSEVPDYGPVWVPRVSAGWAPYRAGRWVYEPYYGWTWVSAEPWGWAPYHYGRLVHLQQFMVLVARSGVRRVSSDLGASVCFVLWFWARIRHQPWRVIWRRVWIDWMASDWTRRLFPSLVGRLSAALQRDRHSQCVQHSRRHQAAVSK